MKDAYLYDCQKKSYQKITVHEHATTVMPYGYSVLQCASCAEFMNESNAVYSKEIKDLNHKPFLICHRCKRNEDIRCQQAIDAYAGEITQEV